MKLETLFASFDKKCKKLEKRAFDILNQKYAISQWEFNYLSETLISDLWQAWCNFCRELLLLSCRGTKDRNGNVILKLNDVLKPKKLFLTHISHHFGLHSEQEYLQTKNIYLSYDGLELNF